MVPGVLLSSVKPEQEMDQSNLPASRHGRLGSGFILLLLAIAVIVGLIAYRQYLGQNHGDQKPLPSSTKEAISGQSSSSIDYQNTRSDVKYVGDAACASCHPAQAESYRHHPMGQALAPISKITAQE